MHDDDMPDDDGGPWLAMFTASDSRAVVEQAIEAWTRVVLDDLAAALADDPDLTMHEKAALIERVAPRVRAQTAAVFLAAWTRLRAEALLDADAGTVH